MPSQYPQDKDYQELRCTLNSLLYPKIKVTSINYFSAESKKDRPRVVIQLDMKQEDCLQAEEYQGICSILIRYFHETHLHQRSIIIHDTYKIYHLNGVNEIDVEYPRGKLSAEPGWHEDHKDTRLSELEKNANNIVEFGMPSLYSEEFLSNVEGSFGYYGLEAFKSESFTPDNDESIIYPRGTSLSEIEAKLFSEAFIDPEQEPDTH